MSIDFTHSEKVAIIIKLKTGTKFNEEISEPVSAALEDFLKLRNSDSDGLVSLSSTKADS